MSGELNSVSGRRLGLRDVAGALPAATVVFLGLFYGLGVLLTTTQLLGAGVSVPQALPLIPLQDHLTKGLGAVFSSAGLGVVFGALLLFFVVSYPRFRRMSAHQRADDASFEAVKRNVQAVDIDELKRERDRFGEETKRLWAALDQAVREGRGLADYQSLLAEQLDRARALQNRLDDNEKLLNETQALMEEADRHRELMGSDTRWMHVITGHLPAIRIGCSGVIAAQAFTLPPPWWIGYLAIAALNLFWHRIGLERIGLVLALFFVGVLTLPVVINEYANPTPLPAVRLVTDAGTVHGSLITSSGDRYVITRRPHTFEEYPSSRVRSATVEVLERRPAKSLFAKIFG